MNIETMIAMWTKQEINSAKLQGIEPKDMKKGLRVAMKSLTKLSMDICDHTQKRQDDKKGKKK